MTVVGPLTTTFRAPTSCTTTTPQIYQVWSGSRSSYVEGPLFTSGSDCFPSGYDPAPANYYSPGWCPHGYTTACSNVASVSTETETTVVCCPTHFNYGCQAPASPGKPSFGCTTAWTSALAVLGVTVVRDGTATTATVVSETSNAITAYGIQVRFKPGDPTPAPTTVDSGFSVITWTSAPPVSIPTQLLVPSPTSSSSSGVSTPAAIGIGVGSAAAALLITGLAGLCFFLRRRRRKRRNNRPQEPPFSSPPPVPPKEFPASPIPYRTVPPPYELSNDASPRRPSTSVSKRHLTMSPPLGGTPTSVRRGDSGVLGNYKLAELEASLPSEASLRDRASPESASSGWTDRQARGAASPMPWI